MLAFHRSDADGSSGSHVNEVTQTSLALDNHERDAHLDAQGWKPDNQLNRIDIVSDHNQLGLLSLNQGSNVAQTKLDDLGGRFGFGGLALCFSLGLSLETCLLLGNSLRTIMGQKFKQSGGLRLVQSSGKLVDAGRDLQALFEDGLLALKANVRRPLNIARKVALRLD